MATRRGASSSQCFSNKLLKFCTNERFEPRSKTREFERGECWGGGERKGEKDGSELNNAPRVYPSSDSSCVSLDFRQQRESAFANFLSPLSVLIALVAVRKSRLIFKRWKGRKLLANFLVHTLFGIKFGSLLFFYQDWLMDEKDKLYV